MAFNLLVTVDVRGASWGRGGAGHRLNQCTRD